MLFILLNVLAIIVNTCFSGSSSGEVLNAKDLSLSKSLSWLLRHGAITEGLKVNEEGFIQLEQVLQHRLFARRCSAADVRRVITLSKNRFTLQANPQTGIYEIRANSGHTFKDSNNQEVKALVKLNRGRPIPQPGLRSVKSNSHNKPQQESLRNYNLPVGNILLPDEDNHHHYPGGRPDNDKLMKYTELKRALIWILRYGAEKEGLTVKRHGYVPVDQILNHHYFKNKCMREDILTVANNEPHNFKVREGPHTQQLYIRARKEHSIKQEHEDWSVVQGVIHLPLGLVVHGINGSEWDFVSQYGLKVPRGGYLYSSPYEPYDCWHTPGVTKYDEIYIYINVHAAIQDGIEFFRTADDSIATKGDSEGFVGTQYFKKVVEAKTGALKFTSEDLKKIFRKFGNIIEIKKQNNASFAFIKFADKSSVEKALNSRVFAGGLRLFVKRYSDQSNATGSNDKSRKLSDTSQSEGAEDLPAEDLPVDLPDPAQCPDPHNVFDWLVHQFISQVELPTEMYQKLNEVMTDVENLFRPLLPGCRVIVFGSCGSTLAFKDSDVDLFLQDMNDQPSDFVRKEAKAMYRSRLFRVLARIPTARVPIVRFEHVKTGWQGDLTANSRLGVCNSRLIRFLISLDPRIRPLLMLVKYWAKVCSITGDHQKLTTYSLVMMVIFYLQQLEPPILPSVATLQRLTEEKTYSQGWECSFCDEEWTLHSECPKKENTLSLKELLTGFFHFYNTFDFDEVICPLLGRSIPVLDFEETENLPDEMQTYKEKVKSDPKIQFRTNVMIKIQDPFELCINITRNVSDKSFFIIKKACEVSCKISEQNDEGSLLKELFAIKKGSLDSSTECIKIIIPYKNESTDTKASLTESDAIQWYELTTDAVLLVLKEILKFTIEPNKSEVSNKVKKFVASHDVHTLPNTFASNEDLVYTCKGDSDVWNSRRKVSKVLNSLNINLSKFEREVCISNTLYQPNKINAVTFNLSITSFDKFNSLKKGVEIVVLYNATQVKGKVKEIGTFLRYSLKTLVLEAEVFITQTKAHTSVAEVKDSLQKLFDLRLARIPDLKSKNHSSPTPEDKCPLSVEEQKETSLAQQRLLLGGLENSNTAIEGSSNSDLASNKSNEVNETEEKQFDPTIVKVSSEDNSGDQIMKSVYSPTRNMPSAETKKVLNELGDMTPAGTSSKGSVKLSGLSETVKKHETLSSCTSINKNPFLASIEKALVSPPPNGDDKSYCSEKEANKKHKDVRKSDKKSVVSVRSSTHEKEVTNVEKISSSSSETFSEERKPSFKQVQQRPKVYMERPHKFRKPLQKSFRTNFHWAQAESNAFRGGRKTGYGQDYSRQSNCGSSSTSRQYYDEYNETAGNHSRSDRSQQNLAVNSDKQRKWYPTLFNRK